MSNLSELNEIFKKTIINVLFTNGPLPLTQILGVVKGQQPHLCDNDVICDHEGMYKGIPEWQHQVRQALMDLRLRGQVKQDGAKWKLAR